MEMISPQPASRARRGAPPAPQQDHDQQRGTQQRAAARGRLHADVRMQHCRQCQAECKHPGCQDERPPPGAALLRKIHPCGLTSRFRKRALHLSLPPFPPVFSFFSIGCPAGVYKAEHLKAV